MSPALSITILDITSDLIPTEPYLKEKEKPVALNGTEQQINMTA